MFFLVGRKDRDRDQRVTESFSFDLWPDRCNWIYKYLSILVFNYLRNIKWCICFSYIPSRWVSFIEVAILRSHVFCCEQINVFLTAIILSLCYQDDCLTFNCKSKCQYGVFRTWIWASYQEDFEGFLLLVLRENKNIVPKALKNSQLKTSEHLQNKWRENSKQ